MRSGFLADKIGSRFSHFCVGSLPFTDAAAAVRFIFERPWILPFWPELPQRSFSEFMLTRTERTASAEWAGYTPEEASGLFAIQDFLQSGAAAPELLKCQLMGPLSFMSYSQRMVGSFRENLDLAAALCLKQLVWQMEFVAGFGSRALFVLDEPALIGWRQLSEEERDMLSGAYSYLYASVSDMDCHFGLHSCAAFEPDFLNFPVELLSFDLTACSVQEVLGGASAAWTDAIRRGVVIVPGVFDSVPQEDCAAAFERGQELYHRAAEYLSGCGGYKILRSAACGHANADPVWLEHLYAKR
jgi:hypothetical protein